uniref:Uncharacterized protein n=1 Tax=Triticum urartu TaxID=4572 RepID=A0A8R7NVJ1_TRIUA
MGVTSTAEMLSTLSCSSWKEPAGIAVLLATSESRSAATDSGQLLSHLQLKTTSTLRLTVMSGLNPSTVNLTQSCSVRWVRDVRFESRAIDCMLDSVEIPSFLREIGKSFMVPVPPASSMEHLEKKSPHLHTINDSSDAMSWILN